MSLVVLSGRLLHSAQCRAPVPDTIGRDVHRLARPLEVLLSERAVRRRLHASLQSNLRHVKCQDRISSCT